MLLPPILAFFAISMNIKGNIAVYAILNKTPIIIIIKTAIQ